MADETIDPSHIRGTDGDDVILLDTGECASAFVTINGATRAIPQPAPPSIFIDGGKGNDKIVARGNFAINLLVTGSGGNDTIIGGNGNDSISGGTGNDKIFGGNGQDNLLGAAGNDYLDGQEGDDTCSGAGGNDRLVDTVGFDHLLGGAGNDVLLARDHDADYISGGAGYDRAQLDGKDGRAGIEELLA